MTSILLPSGKSINAPTLDLLEKAGIRMRRSSPGCDTGITLSGIRWPKTAAFVHQSRIPQLVDSGQYTLGIVGLDSVRESGVQVEVCADLLFNRSTFSKAKIVLFAAENGIANVKDIPDGTHVLAEYPYLARAFFQPLGIQVTVVASRGSVESEVPEPYPLGVCLSETGQSLRAHRLRPIATLLETSTVLIANKDACTDPQVREDIAVFKSILLGVLAAREKVMLYANVPSTSFADALAVLPSLRSPTVTPLANSTFVSVSAVIDRTELNLVQENLMKCGAEGIVVMPITSLI